MALLQVSQRQLMPGLLPACARHILGVQAGNSTLLDAEGHDQRTHPFQAASSLQSVVH